jgi:hypothetical protein
VNIQWVEKVGVKKTKLVDHTVRRQGKRRYYKARPEYRESKDGHTDDPQSASCRKCSVSRLMIKRRGSRHIRHRNRVTAVIVKVIRDDFYIERRK